MNHATPQKKKYHHGDLADTLIRAAVSLLREKGPAQLSLREVARVAGVSHGAPAHHFCDKAGLLTAIAVQGHQLLAAAIVQAQALCPDAEQELLAAGEAYIRFALNQPAHFAVMFQSGLINREDAAYQAASAVARKLLEDSVRKLVVEGVASDREINATVIALWSQVHGFATLWLAGNFGDPEDTSVLEDLLISMLASITPRMRPH